MLDWYSEFLIEAIGLVGGTLLLLFLLLYPYVLFRIWKSEQQ